MVKTRVCKVNKKDFGAYATIIHDELGYTSSEARTYLSRKNIDNMLKIEVDKMPIGFVNFTRNGHVIYVNDIDVAQSHRRMGYGSCLLHSLELRTKRQGSRRIRLHVRVDNTPATDFYLKNGYTIGKRVKGFYAKKFDAYVIEKLLDSNP
ncbi:MAG: GNAT family N-acetyltransferase [Euryarchaeota archaeon]|nr:GNAT family N-acetyltransferase [Euryarchaeota archaeon]